MSEAEWCPAPTAGSAAAANRLVVTVPMTATPRALPISRAALLRPDPSPARCDGTAPMIPMVSGGSVSPMPPPAATRKTAYSAYGVWEPDHETHSRDAAMSRMPAAITGRAPNRAVSREARRETSIMHTASGRKATPAVSGLMPLTYCRYWALVKKSANIAKNAAVTPSAPARSRGVRNSWGSSMGRRLRACWRAKTVRTSTPRTKALTMGADDQPTAGPSMMP